MFLLKDREYLILNGTLFQLDVSFKKDTDDYESGYYLALSKIAIVTKDNAETVKRFYSDGKIELLLSATEETDEGLEEAMYKKNMLIEVMLENTKYFSSEKVQVRDDVFLNYRKNSVASNCKNTIDLLNSLVDNHESTFKQNVNLNIKNSKKSNKNSKKDEGDKFDNIKPSKKDKSITFNEIGGLKEVKEELLNIVDYINNTDKYKDMDVEIEKGVLLYGPPGTGKTRIAKALANETNSNFFEVSGSEFVEKFVGVGAKRVRKLFENARKKAPSIIFIDELDSIGKKRGSGQSSDEREQTINELLVQLDGFKGSEGVMVIAATNRLDTLDEALIRAGRFGQHLYIGNPDLESRIELFKIHTKKKPLCDSIDLSNFAKNTHGFSGADIKQICNTAGLLAIRDNRNYIVEDDFNKAIDRVVVGLNSKTKKMIDEEKKIVAYHESGHAIANKILGKDEIRKISIIPTGTALGFVYHLPNEDRFLSTKSELKNKIKILLAGKVAEELVFGEATNGASNDLEKASTLALKMVKQYGMDENNSLLSIGDLSSSSKDDKMRAEKILSECYDECKSLISSFKDALDTTAKLLIEKEEINNNDFDEIMKSYI